MSTPELAGSLGISAGLALALTLGVGGLFVGLTPALLSWTRRARRPLALALVAIAGCALALGLTPWIALALAAMLAWGPAATVACALAEARLVAALGPERATAQWAVAGAVGDLVAPALVLVATYGAVAGADGRGAYVGVALLALAIAWAAARFGEGAGDPEAADADEALPWREALKEKRVVLALAAETACTLLDEIVLAFAALDLEARFGFDGATRALVLGAMTAAQLVALVALERLTARGISAARALVASGVACAALFTVVVTTSSAPVYVTALVLAGAAAAWHHPLASALTYSVGRAHGRDALTIAAAGALFEPLELLAPFALAWVADGFSVRAALAMLLLQPVLVAFVGWRLGTGAKGA